MRVTPAKVVLVSTVCKSLLAERGPLTRDHRGALIVEAAEAVEAADMKYPRDPKFLKFIALLWCECVHYSKAEQKFFLHACDKIFKSGVIRT